MDKQDLINKLVRARVEVLEMWLNEQWGYGPRHLGKDHPRYIENEAELKTLYEIQKGGAK